MTSILHAPPRTVFSCQTRSVRGLWSDILWLLSFGNLFSNSASAQWFVFQQCKCTVVVSYAFLLPLWQFLLPVSLETGVHFGSVSVTLIPGWIDWASRASIDLLCMASRYGLIFAANLHLRIIEPFGNRNNTVRSLGKCLRFDLFCVIRRRTACGYHVLERCRYCLLLCLFVFCFFCLGREIFGKISHDPL